MRSVCIVYESVCESVASLLRAIAGNDVLFSEKRYIRLGLSRAGRKETTVKSINGVQLASTKLVLFAAFVIAFPMPRKW